MDGLFVVELANFHDVSALRFVMASNMLNREARFLSSKILKLRETVFRLKGEQSVSSATIARLEAKLLSVEGGSSIIDYVDVHDLMSKNEKLKKDIAGLQELFQLVLSSKDILECDAKALQSRCHKFDEKEAIMLATEASLKAEIESLKEKLDSAMEDRSLMVTDLLPHAVKVLLSSDSFSTLLADLQKKAMLVGRAQALEELVGESLLNLESFAELWKYSFFELCSVDGDNHLGNSKASTATIRDFTLSGASDRGLTMSMPHCMKGHAAVTDVMSCFGNLEIATSDLGPACSPQAPPYYLMWYCFASYDPLTWLATIRESTKTVTSSIFISLAMWSPAMMASYSASLLVAVNSNFKAYVNSVPYGLTIIKPAPEPSPLDAPSCSLLRARRVGIFSMYLFISLKVLSASLVHVNYFLSRQPFSVLKKGKDFSALLDMNLFRAASFPLRFRTSLMVFGLFRLIRAWIFVGLALMPCFDNTCPRNWPSSIPKEHFFGLSFMLIFWSLLKVSRMSAIMFRTGNEKLSYARHLLPFLLGDSCHVRVLQSEYVDIVFEQLGQLLFGLCGELSSDGHRLLQVS
ncbi:hypothetical protein Tco_0803881 [Tanacetum coccineum]|uniref:Uncharacterized protein n=1 Tax=Tanacetum coccineum TaxID=301880 RepID=A0ABQ5A4H6_9ASTR